MFIWFFTEYRFALATPPLGIGATPLSQLGHAHYDLKVPPTR